MNIYVGNLNYRVKEGDLQQVMEDYGAVSSVKVVMDRETGKSKGFAFIEMEDDAAAAKAIAELNANHFLFLLRRAWHLADFFEILEYASRL